MSVVHETSWMKLPETIISTRAPSVTSEATLMGSNMYSELYSCLKSISLSFNRFRPWSGNCWRNRKTRSEGKMEMSKETTGGVTSVKDNLSNTSLCSLFHWDVFDGKEEGGGKRQGKQPVHCQGVRESKPKTSAHCCLSLNFLLVFSTVSQLHKMSWLRSSSRPSFSSRLSVHAKKTSSFTLLFSPHVNLKVEGEKKVLPSSHSLSFLTPAAVMVTHLVIIRLPLFSFHLDFSCTFLLLSRQDMLPGPYH